METLEPLVNCISQPAVFFLPEPASVAQKASGLFHKEYLVLLPLYLLLFVSFVYFCLVLFVAVLLSFLPVVNFRFPKQ